MSAITERSERSGVEMLHVAMLMTGPMNETRFWFLTELYLRALLMDLRGRRYRACRPVSYLRMG